MPGIEIRNTKAFRGKVEWGTPGETWKNTTERIWYQFHAHWQNTCGVCAQYDGAVREGSWPIGFHRGCNCTQDPIAPGQSAPMPFTDFRETIASLDDAQKRACVGASNYKLIADGVVKWEDVVSPFRVRTLREVVATQKLTVKQMTDAGVKPKIAKDAYAAVHTPVHQIVEQHRKELLQNLQNAGLSKDQVATLASQGIAERVHAPRSHGGSPAPVGSGIDLGLLRSALASGRPVLARAALAPKEPKPPVTGAMPPTLEAFAEEATKAANAVPESQRFDESRVWIADAYAEFKREFPDATPSQFKSWLVRAHKRELLKLHGDGADKIDNPLKKASATHQGMSSFYWIGL